MVPRKRLIERLRAKGYAYKSETSRTQMYRRPGDPRPIFVPKAQLIEEEAARAILRQAGESEDEIREFLDGQSGSATN